MAKRQHHNVWRLDFLSCARRRLSYGDHTDANADKCANEYTNEHGNEYASAADSYSDEYGSARYEYTDEDTCAADGYTDEHAYANKQHWGQRVPSNLYSNK